MDILIAWLVAATVFLIAVVALRPALTDARGGKILAFGAFFVLPVLATLGGVSAHLEHSKSTEFCMSCHEMEAYGQSLLVDDSEYVPANHYQNRRIDREHACFTCHTDYTMFGDVTAKLRGLKHVWVHYFGDVPPPGEIELYTPYQNRECLHCHAGARSYTENPMHEDMLGDLAADEVSCLDCHASFHDVGDLGGQAMWQPEEPTDLGQLGGQEETRCVTATKLHQRLRLSGGLLAGGLVIEALTLFWSHPTAFLAFLGLGGVLVAAGLGIYAWAVVSR